MRVDTENEASVFLKDLADDIATEIEGEFINEEAWVVRVDGERIIVEHDP